MTDQTVVNALKTPGQLPRFDLFRVDQVTETIGELADRYLVELEQIEKNVSPTWESAVASLTDLEEPLSYAFAIVGHLLAVQNSPELRTAHESVLPRLVETSLRRAQSNGLYKALLQLKESDEWQKLDGGRRRVIESMIRDSELAGVGLEGPQRERFQEIEKELAELSTKFVNNVLDATKAFSLVLTDPDEIEGLPSTARGMAAQYAAAAGDATESDPDKGPWRITLDLPMYLGFLMHAKRRDLREKVFRAHVVRASSGDLNNEPLIDRILELRAEQASLLGYENYADVSLATKMAPSIEAIYEQLDSIRESARPKASEEFEYLQEFARRETGDAGLELQPWDNAFWGERLREKELGYTDEDLRPYFSLPRVLDGLFGVAEKVLGVRIEAADDQATFWDPAVRFFQVKEADGTPIASFCLDAYSRPENKRGGAWMNWILPRKLLADGTLQLPVAWLMCNQTPPVGDKPSLMSFGEVRTLFHEFGHGLQHMLTQVDFAEASGLSNIEWDAVELASTFMENWCYHRETLLGMAKHFETGETISEDLYQKISKSRQFRIASLIINQLFYSELDLRLHDGFTPGQGQTPNDLKVELGKKHLVRPQIPEDRLLCSFSHIFAGGYAAGYYSYLWASVLAADAWEGFVEAGLDEKSIGETGARYRRTVLGLGGTEHPIEVFKKFRGREPEPEPLLRQLGLA